MDRLKDLSTFDLAFNLATGVYDEKEKFEALSIIKSREINKTGEVSETKNLNPDQPVTPPKPKKKPLKGSKAEKIQKLIDAGKTAKEIYEKLNSTGTKVYYPEIYRLIKSK